MKPSADVGRRTGVTGKLAALCLALAMMAACGESGSSSHRPQVRGQPSTPTAAGNHAAATQEAERLLSLVRLPDRAQALDSPPPHLDGPATGKPAVSSLIDQGRFWSVPMSFDAAAAWFQSHPPAGNLSRGGTATGGGPAYQTAGVAYDDAHNPAWSQAELQVGVSSGDSNQSYVRADAVVVWLDPRPVRDTSSGPRTHFTVADGCPADDRGVPDVVNHVAGLGQQILPDEKPQRAIVCRYDGGNGQAFSLLTHRLLGAAAAHAAAARIRRLPLAHPDGAVSGCPNDDGSTGYLAFAYPRGASIDVKVDLSGCAMVTNGTIQTQAGNTVGLFSPGQRR